MRQHAPKISIFTSSKLKQREEEGECEKGACGKDREMCDRACELGKMCAFLNVCERVRVLILDNRPRSDVAG